MIRKQRAWVAPRPGETRRSGFKSLRPHHPSGAAERCPIIDLTVGLAARPDGARPQCSTAELAP
jgi:hypothetical protein